MIYTYINHPLPGLVHMFSLQLFSSIFESIVHKYIFSMTMVNKINQKL